MRAAGRGMLLALGLLLAGCREDPMARLSADEAVAYTVLAEELQRMADSDPPTTSVNLCVNVSLPGGGKVRDMAGLVQMLKSEMPHGLIADLVPLEHCKKFSDFGQYRTPSGARAYVFFASPRRDDIDPGLPAGEREWYGGTICGALCGMGNTYLVKFEDGRPILTDIGDWVS